MRYLADVKRAAVERYVNGEPAGAIAHGVGCRHETILSWVDQAEIARVPVRVSMRKARSLPPDVLTLDWASTEAGAWAIGLFVSDGTLRRPRPTSRNSRPSVRVRVALAERDRGGVLAFARALGLDPADVRNTLIGGRPMSYAELAHPRLEALFCDVLGFTPGRKVGSVSLPGPLAENPHAWRGVLDGDGYVSLSAGRGPQLRLSLGLRNESDALHDQFAAFARTIVGVTAYRYEARSVATGPRAVALIDTLYSRAIYTIARKHDKALALRDAYRERSAAGARGAPPTARQEELLEEVAIRGPITAADLASEYVPASARARVAALRNTLTALERRGLVSARNDRRGHEARIYEITASGSELLGGER